MSEKVNTSCQSCLMPFGQDPCVRESDLYCSLCFRGGEFCYKGTDLKEFQQICYQAMVKSGKNKYLAKLFAWAIRFAPRWKR